MVESDMFLFSGRQMFLYSPKPYSFRVFVWEWNNIDGLSISNEEGKKLIKIPKKVIDGIENALKEFKKTNYPWLKSMHSDVIKEK